MPRKTKKLIAAFFIALGVFGVSSILKLAPLLETQQKTLSNKLYGERELTDEIVIVALDEKSMLSPELGGLGGYSEWNNTYYAEVIRNIEAENPSVLYLDILFNGSSQSISLSSLYDLVQEEPTSETFIEEVLSYLGEVHPYDQELIDVFSAYENIFLAKSVGGEGTYDGTSYVYENTSAPLAEFTEQVQTGFWNTHNTEDNLNRNYIYGLPVYFTVDGVTEPHVDVKIAEYYLGGTQEIPQEDGQMLINYYQKPHGFPYVSFSDVYRGNVEPGTFEGKIVLVGATSTFFQDVYFTPIDETVEMPGVEIHANAIQTILDEAYLEYQSTGEFLAMVGLITLASVFVFLYAPVLAGAGFLVLEIVAFPFYAQWSFNRGTVVDLIWPVFGIVLAYLAVLAYRNFTEFSEKRKLKTAFSRYVSKELAEEITEKPELLQLGGERRNITALFLDIENFTNLSEGLAPQEVVRIINVYFDALAGVIMEHEGSVDKYEGDAIMALWGAPLPMENHAEKACRAALAIQAKMKELNAQMGYNLNIRVGLATGDAIVGNMGSSERFDYTAMGDTVNTASRLEGANKFYKTGILVGPGTREAASAGVLFRQVDTVCLKGKDNPIGIYEVMGTAEGASEEGKKLVEEWHRALEAYKAGDWKKAEAGMKAVLEKLPEDGPAKTLLARMAELRLLPRGNWDGVWRFESK